MARKGKAPASRRARATPSLNRTPVLDPRVEHVPLDALLGMRHHGNPKKHDLGQLAASFARFGFVAYPTLDEATGVLVAGHGRCEALAMMRDRGDASPNGITIADGAWMVPAIRGVSFRNDDERDAYLIADNQHTIGSGWDMEALSNMVGSMRLRVADAFEGLGFPDLEAFTRDTSARIENLSRDASADRDAKPSERPSPPPIVVPEPISPPRKPTTKLGDVYRLDGSVLICGSCAEVDPDLLRVGELGFGFTSPPYNAGSNFVKGGATGKSRYGADVDDEMDDDEFAALLDAATSLLLRTCAVAGINIQSLANNKRVVARWAARNARHLVDRVVWAKDQSAPQIASRVMTNAFEDIYLLSPKINPTRAIPTADFQGTVSNVHRGPNAARDNDYADIHNATMPVHLASFAIGTLAAKADFVVDPFGGIGTTAMVALASGKRFATVELSPAYCDVIVDRWTRAAGKTPSRA